MSGDSLDEIVEEKEEPLKIMAIKEVALPEKQ
jgi:hypothetical protein